jgi:hypothetical protein
MVCLQTLVHRCCRGLSSGSKLQTFDGKGAHEQRDIPPSMWHLQTLQLRGPKVPFLVQRRAPFRHRWPPSLGFESSTLYRGQCSSTSRQHSSSACNIQSGNASLARRLLRLCMHVLCLGPRVPATENPTREPASHRGFSLPSVPDALH